MVQGDMGVEGGCVILDEEYRNACRITLEYCKKYCAITCGIYGGMMHTAFCGMENSAQVYAAMKKDLEEFLDKKTSEDEALAFYREFTSKY